MERRQQNLSRMHTQKNIYEGIWFAYVAVDDIILDIIFPLRIFSITWDTKKHHRLIAFFPEFLIPPTQQQQLGDPSLRKTDLEECTCGYSSTVKGKTRRYIRLTFAVEQRIVPSLLQERGVILLIRLINGVISFFIVWKSLKNYAKFWWKNMYGVNNKAMHLYLDRVSQIRKIEHACSRGWRRILGLFLPPRNTSITKESVFALAGNEHTYF